MCGGVVILALFVPAWHVAPVSATFKVFSNLVQHSMEAAGQRCQKLQSSPKTEATLCITNLHEGLHGSRLHHLSQSVM